MEDLTSRVFGRWTVLELDTEYEKHKKGSNRKWICQCECGTIKSVFATKLRSGASCSCGCLNKEKIIQRNYQRAENLIGQVFNRLTVVDMVIRNNRTVYKCRCQCGNEILTTGARLKSGHTKSCGCLQKEVMQSVRFVDETGNTYGRLKVLQQDGWVDKRREAIWVCQCECGNIIKVPGGNLRSGNTQSCGCIGASRGEFAVEQLLKANKIPYKREYWFSDLLSEKGNPLRFDFCIFKNKEPYYFIECDGKQHFEYGGFTYTKEETELLWQRDRQKEEYLRAHNYHLIRIPYQHYDQIALDDITIQSQFLMF